MSVLDSTSNDLTILCLTSGHKAICTGPAMLTSKMAIFSNDNSTKEFNSEPECDDMGFLRLFVLTGHVYLIKEFLFVLRLNSAAMEHLTIT